MWRRSIEVYNFYISNTSQDGIQNVRLSFRIMYGWFNCWFLHRTTFTSSHWIRLGCMAIYRASSSSLSVGYCCKPSTENRKSSSAVFYFVHGIWFRKKQLFAQRRHHFVSTVLFVNSSYILILIFLTEIPHHCKKLPTADETTMKEKLTLAL